MTNKSRSKKGAGKTMHLLTGFLVLLVTAIIAISYANITLAAGEGQKDTVQGEVVAVDNLHHIRMLTLRSEEIGNFPNDSLNIFLNQNTIVKVCNKREPSKDIGVSRDATVTYHEVRGWLPVANTVSEHC